MEVLHYPEILLKYESKLKLSLDEPLTVTLHDPCHLARSLDMAEEPRQVLSLVRGLELKEVPYTNRRMTTCCGSPIETIFPFLAEKIGCKRVTELGESGAKIELTLCPFCLGNLRGAAKNVNSDLNVIDFIEILGQGGRSLWIRGLRNTTRGWQQP